MRWAVLCCALVSAFLVSGAAGAAADGSPRDFVVGGGQHLAFGTGPGVVAVGISAHSGPAGEAPHGSLTWTNKGEGTQSFHAKVICLIVVGNEAFATGVFTHPAANQGQIVVLDAVDNGNPHSGVPDLIRFSFEGAIEPVPGQPNCFLPLLPPVPVTKGNLLVHDATP
jgi:hypothetical protein